MARKPAKPDVVNDPRTADRRTYMRDLMRKKRALKRVPELEAELKRLRELVGEK